jgi:PhoPQ-activated pathogenicity-related protein
MPTFDGDIRQYPRFKKDFEQQVLPGLPKESQESRSAPYALRSCLDREPLSIVRSVEDDMYIEKMLKHLDEKYGDPTKIADVVIESIKEVKVIKEGEHKRFINFVNIVEDAYQDLRRLGLEKEITTTS